MNKIYILDAVNYLFRSYYAIGPMTNARGESTSALYGFIRSLQKLIRDFEPNHLIAVFDGPDNKKSRQAVYADYKMHRKGAPEDLFPQFAWAYEFCEIYGVATLSVDGVEADDTMASISAFAKKKGAEVFLCSSDKDLMQIVDEQVQMLHLHKENRQIGPNEVQELYGVRPDQMLDFLAIMGDASDNIPGLPGFGAKTAASLLQEFGTLDALLAHPERIKGAKKQEVLREQKELALMSRSLATLDLQVEIPQTENFYELKEPDLQKLSLFYERMNFQSLQKELFSEKDLKKNQKRTDINNKEYLLVDSEEQLKKLFSFLHKQKEICIDTETTGLDPHRAELVGVGLSARPGEAFYLPCNGEIGKENMLSSLRHFFSECKSSFTGHNIKYDWHVLQHHDIELKSIGFDTLLASWILSPQTRRHNLDDLSTEHLKVSKIPLSNLIGKGRKQISMAQVPLDRVTEYCCEDVDMTYRLKELFQEELEERNLSDLFYQTEMPLLPILANMEHRGIYLNQEKLQQLGSRYTQAIGQLKVEIFEMAQEEFNLNSPKQLSGILYDKMGLKVPGKKQAKTSTSAAILEQLAEEHPFAQKILDYRTLEKLRSTYVEALPSAVHPETGRIHCTFNQSSTATGRLSCQDPNLQNIPIRGAEGKKVRSCFEPQKADRRYLCADYSQIELRLLAHFSEDAELMRAFWQKEDIHKYSASLVFDVSLNEVTPEMRSQAKAVNFGILYGQGPYGLSKQTGLSMKEAALFIETYFKRYPGVSRYIESAKELARQKGYSTTLLGRKRPIAEITNQNPSIRSMAERLAVNSPLQGSTADLMKCAMIEIEKAFSEKNMDSGMILQIHDELIFELPKEQIDEARLLVKEKMETIFSLKVPLEVSIGIGKNWGEC